MKLRQALKVDAGQPKCFGIVAMMTAFSRRVVGDPVLVRCRCRVIKGHVDVVVNPLQLPVGIAHQVIIANVEKNLRIELFTKPRNSFQVKGHLLDHVTPQKMRVEIMFANPANRTVQAAHRWESLFHWAVDLNDPSVGELPSDTAQVVAVGRKTGRLEQPLALGCPPLQELEVVYLEGKGRVEKVVALFA
ncbi:MAG: hypothetical protein P8N76_28580 [Pirellulaceae bacterium]|nr:hypothetical protein [Pirellulaceae bacterium]